MRVLLAILCAVLPAGCGTNYTIEPETGPHAHTPAPVLTETSLNGPIEVVSPSNGVVVSSPWIPIALAMPVEWTGVRVVTTLDGAPADDPLGLVRTRWIRHGESQDYLATLDLLEVADGTHTIAFEVTHDAAATPWRISSAFMYDRPRFRLDVRVVDEAGGPTSARIAVFGPEGPHQLASPDAAAVDRSGRDAFLHSFFVVGGEGAVYLDPGPWRLVALRGFRDDLAAAEIELDADASMTFRIRRAVPTPGYLTADLHVHTGRSGDSAIPDRIRLESLVAADLDVVVATDHLRVVDPRPLLAELGEVARGVHGLPGIEETIRRTVGATNPVSIGHFNAFPQDPGVPHPEVAPDTPVAGYLDAYRAGTTQHPFAGIDPGILMLNHPRGIQFWPHEVPLWGAHALFTELGFTPWAPLSGGENTGLVEPLPGSGTTALEWDALEVVNRFSLPLYLRVRADWFALLNQGVRLTGTGNSDSHAMAVELAGFPANLVRAPGPEQGADLDAAAFVDALRAGRVLVSSGPVVEILVTGAEAATVGDTVTAREGRVAVEARVRSAPWVPVAEVRLVVDGVVRQRESIEASGVDASFEWELAVTEDSWLIVEAGWPVEGIALLSPKVDGPYGEMLPGYVPIGFTNPVWIDADGDGSWIPPGLASDE